MIKNIAFVTFLCFVFGSKLFAQTEQIRNTIQFDRKEGRNLSEVILQKPATEGTSYLDDNWYEGIILLNPNSPIDGYQVRYDVANNLLELKSVKQQTVKAIPTERVYKVKYKNILLNDSIILVNSKTLSNKIANCLIEEVVVGDKSSLYIQYYSTLIKSNYVAEFDAGEKADKIVVNEKLFVLANNELHEFPRSKKKFLMLFPNSEEAIENYLKENKINLSKKEHVIRLIEYINTL